MNTAILYARMAITVFFSLYSTRLVLAALGADDFGVFNVVGGVIALLGFLNTSMAAATQRYMSYAQGVGDADRVTRIFNMSTVLHWCVAVAVLLALEVAGYFFFNGVLNIAVDRLGVAKLIYQFMAVSTFITVLSVPYEAVITSHENMLFYAVIGIAESVLKLAIAVYITYSSYDHLVLYGFLMTALSILLLVVRRVYCHRTYPECELAVRKYYDGGLLREMACFAGWSFVGSSSSMVANYGQGIVLNVFFGTGVNAAQGIAGQISGQLGVFAATLMKALNPMIAKSEGAGNRPLMLQASMTGSKISFWLLAFLYIPFLFEMPYILHLWLKNVPQYTVVFCRLLLLRNLVEQLYIPLTTSISAVGKIRRFQSNSFFLNIAPLLVSYFLFAHGSSPVAIYLCFFVFSSAMFCYVIWMAKVNCGLPVTMFLKSVVLRTVGIFVLSVLVSLVPFSLLAGSLSRLVGVTVVSVTCFLTLLWWWGLSPEERQSVVNLKRAVENGLRVKFCS